VLVLEYKAVVSKNQITAIEKAIRTTQFIRNKAIRFWMDAPKDKVLLRWGVSMSMKYIKG
jgi:putative transposase